MNMNDVQVGKKYRFFYNGKPRIVAVEEVKPNRIIGPDYCSSNGHIKAFRFDRIEKGTLKETV